MIREIITGIVCASFPAFLAADSFRIEGKIIAQVECGKSGGKPINFSLIREIAFDPDINNSARQVDILNLSKEAGEEDAENLWSEVTLAWRGAHPIPFRSGSLLCDGGLDRLWLFTAYIQGLDLDLRAYLVDLKAGAPVPSLGPEVQVGGLTYRLQEYKSAAAMKEHLSWDQSCGYENMDARWEGVSIAISLENLRDSSCRAYRVIFSPEAEKFVPCDP